MNSFVPWKITRAAGIFCLLFAIVGSSASAVLAICCNCHPNGDTKTNVCLTGASDTCDQIIAQSKNPNLSGYSCESAALDLAVVCQPASKTTPKSICTQGPTDAAVFFTSTSKATSTPIVPALEVSIPGLTFASQYPITTQGHQRTIEIPILAQYVSGVYQYLLGISIIAAAVMIVYGGLLYIVGSSAGNIDKGKTIILDSIAGLVLIMSIYTIVNVINPAVLQMNAIKVPIIEPQIFSIPENLYQGFQQLAAKQGYTPDPDIAKAVKGATGGTQPGSRLFPNNPFDSRTSLPLDQLNNILTTVAQKNGLDPCVLKAIAATESGGKQNAVGHDEDAPYVGVQARLDFLRAGKYFSGKTFERPAGLLDDCTGQRAACQTAISQSTNIRNDDTLTMDPPDFGIDWRFSHGFGFAQCTIFKKGAKNSCTGPNGENGVQFGDTCFTVPILLTWEGQTDCMARIIKGIAAKTQDPCTIFRNYSGDQQDTQCTGPLLSKKMDAYTACKGG